MSPVYTHHPAAPRVQSRDREGRAVVIDPVSKRTAHPKVWAGGDVCAGRGNHGAAHDGQWAGRAIDAYLSGGYDEWRTEAAASNDAGKKRPVLFWIHGGGFTSGNAIEQDGYNGENFARFGDVVFVSINHRLGPLGFCNLAGVGGEKFAASGNVGMLDIVAITWSET